jgi:ABC-type branched-subunit amino acid transport system ATPase component
MVRIENLNFSFNSSKSILDNVSLQLEQGQIYALMGTNGAGKSTLFNIITGFIKPQSGTIFLDSTNTTKKSPYKINRIGIGRTFQDLRLIIKLTVRENIQLAFKNNISDNWYATLFPSKKLKAQQIEFEEKTNQILNDFHLTEVQEQLASDISYGQQKLLTLACCVANEPSVLLLDEPVAGVNPVFRNQMIISLQNLKKQGKIILLIEHNTEFIQAVADSIFFLTEGKITQYKNLDELKKDDKVMNAYM